MRQLTKRQKTYLDKIYANSQATSVEDLSAEDYKTLEKINDTEILYQEVNRYLWDKKWERNIK